MNALFAAGEDLILRVGRPTAHAGLAVDLVERLAEAGVPVPRAAWRDVVEHAGLSVTAWSRLVSNGRPIDWRSVGSAVRRLHGVGRDVLPAGYPVPSPASFPWWHFDSLFAEVEDLLDPAAARGLRAAIDRDAEWRRFDPGGAVVCHGDVHPGNVMMTADGPVLIDWDLLCHAPPGWDHAPMMTWTERWGGRPGEYEAFAAGYGRSLHDDPTATAFARLRLVAATLMRVRAGRADPVAAAEAERRLRYWRGDPAAPQWRPQ
jgi:Ser/Thr protein kinase RdoA (MazF antagonist)